MQAVRGVCRAYAWCPAEPPVLPRKKTPLTKRRQWITAPGDHLLLHPSVTAVENRLRSWTEFTGLRDEDTLLSPLCAVPLPAYGTIPAGRRRWPGLRPEAMWHPLLWLPERMIAPRRLHDEASGREWPESTAEYVIRIALELSESGPSVIDGTTYVRTFDYATGRIVRPAEVGDKELVDLYDPITGTWLDVLSTVGLDVDSAIDLARVEAWLNGEPDELLDAIDLERFLSARGRDADWAVERTHRQLDDTEQGGTCATYAQDLCEASTALVANDLADLAEELIQAPPALEQLIARTHDVISLARDWTSLEEFGHQVLTTRLQELAEEVAAASTAAELVQGPLPQLVELLGEVARTSVVAIDRLTLRAEHEAIEILEQIEAGGHSPTFSPA